MLGLDATGAPKWFNHFNACTFAYVTAVGGARGPLERTLVHECALAEGAQVAAPYSDSAILNVRVSSS